MKIVQFMNFVLNFNFTIRLPEEFLNENYTEGIIFVGNIKIIQTILTQGCSISPICITNFFISAIDNTLPIITDFLHALEANIARTRDGLHIVLLDSYKYEKSHIRIRYITICMHVT